MNKIFFIFFIFITLIACKDADLKLPITVSGIGDTITIDENEEYNLSVSGFNNTITIGENNKINNLHISGYNNLIKINKFTTINTFYVSGYDNTIYVPIGSKITFDNSGSGNQLIEKSF